MWIESGHVSQTITKVHEGIQSGSEVIIVSSEAGSIRADDCMRLVSREDVIAVGAVNSRRVVSSPRAPTTPFQLVSVSPGYIDVISSAPPPDSPDIYLGPVLAEELGVRQGNQLDLIGQPPLSVQAVLRDISRAPMQSRWAFTNEWPGSEVLECWIETTPDANDAFKQAVPAIFAEDQDLAIDVAAREANDPLATWSERFTKWYWIGSSFVAAGLIAINMLSRRNEYALYQVLGWPRVQVLLIAVIEHLSIVMTGAVLATLTVIAAQATSQLLSAISLGWALLQLLLSASVLFSTIPLLAFLATQGNKSILVKNRD